MSWPVRAVAVLIGIGFTLVSIIINLRYGNKLASEGIDKYVYITVSVLADLWKAVGAVFITAALRRLHVLRALAGCAVWLVCVVYSLTSALGYAAHNRAVMAGGVVSKGNEVAGLERERARKQGQLDRLGSYEPSSVIEQRINGVKQKPEWLQSAGCTTASQPKQRTHCAEHQGLETELSKAREGEKMEAELAALAVRMAALGGSAPRVAAGDSQAGTLAALLGLSLPVMQTGLSLLLVMVVELGSTLILFVALQPPDARRNRQDQAKQAPGESAIIPVAVSVEPVVIPAPALVPPLATGAGTAQQTAAGRERPPAPAPAGASTQPPGPASDRRRETDETSDRPREEGRIEVFLVEALDHTPGHRVEVRELEQMYRVWCRRSQKRAVGPVKFERAMRDLCAEVGYRQEERRGKVVVIGLKERPPGAGETAGEQVA